MNEEFKKILRVVVGDWDVNLVFRWEHGDWVCRMTNDFMEELQTESKNGEGE